MSTSLLLCIGPLIGLLILSELTFRIGCTEHDTKCYPVANRSICFFRTQELYDWVTWHKATETCRSRNGTLPTIPDKATQDVFKEYMGSLVRLYEDDMWLAAREVRRKEWTWANGQPFNEPTAFAQYHSEYTSYHVQASLTKNLVYRKEFPGNRSHYVCQFFGEACQSSAAILLKNGCVIANDGALDFYDARNKCLEKGGDLPMIEGQDDVNKLRRVFSQNPAADKIWLGLRRQWWNWNSTGSVEMKYSNWFLDNGFKPHLDCTVFEIYDYQWKQENCSFYKRFVCQTNSSYVVVPTSPTSIVVSTGFLFFVVGISTLVLAILLITVVVIVIVKRRKTRIQQPIMDVVSYQHLQLPGQEQNYSKGSNQQYMQPHPLKKMPPLPTTPLPFKSQQSEQSPESLYDEIIDPRDPKYIDVIR